MFADHATPEATFPLLSLPNHLIKNVINQMSIFKMFGFSLISKRACQLVSGSHHTNLPQNWPPSVVIGNSIEVKIDMFSHFTLRPTHHEIDQSPVQKIKMTGPVRNWSGFEHFSKAGYTMQDWVRHIFKVFNCSYETVELTWHEDSERYSVASVKRVLPKCDWLIINISNPQFELVTDTLLAKSIRIGRHVLEELHLTKRMQKIQMQNFSQVIMFSNTASFDTQLMANSKCFQVCSSHLTYKEANRFLKLWARGAMPNLKHFSSAVRRETPSVEETIKGIFKGIEHSRSIEQVDCQECKSVRQGGFVIYRVGGIKATINIDTEDSDEYVLFDIFVEH